jgi:S1-C subfamily serine protease
VIDPARRGITVHRVHFRLFAVSLLLVVLASCAAEQKAVTWDAEPTAEADVPVPPFVTEPLTAGAVSSTFLDRLRPALVLIGTARSWGTGFVVAARNGERIVVTNHHVVAGALGKKGRDGIIRGYFNTHTGDPDGVNAVVLAADEQRDIAILKLRSNDPNVAALRLSSTTAASGRVVVAGFPWGNLSVTGENTAPSFNYGQTDGEVKRRYGAPFVKVVAGIFPGNSGGPVLSNTGDVIGVATLQAYSAASIAGAALFNYAVPIADVIAFAKKKKIDLRSDRTIAGGFEEEAVVPPLQPQSLDVFGVLESGAASSLCVVVARNPGGVYVCNTTTTPTEAQGQLRFANGVVVPRVMRLEKFQEFTLYRSDVVPPAAAILAEGAALTELSTIRRVRLVGKEVQAATVRLSSVRHNSEGGVTQVLADPGYGDSSAAGGFYVTNDGHVIGPEWAALVGSNLRAAMPVLSAWSSINGAAANADTRHVVGDAHFSAVFPQFAAHEVAHYGTSPVRGERYLWTTKKARCVLEAFPIAPEPMEALLGRPGTNVLQSKATHDETSIVRVDILERSTVWRHGNGTSYLRVLGTGDDAEACATDVHLATTTAAAEVTSSWERSLRRYTDTLPKRARPERTVDDFRYPDTPVCGGWSWPTVKSADRTFRIAMPCTPTKEQSLAGGVLTSTLVARPSSRHAFEAMTLAVPGGDGDGATSSWDAAIDAIIQTRVLDAVLERLDATAGGSRGRDVTIVEGDDVHGVFRGTEQLGRTRDGRVVDALAVRDRNVVYVAVAVVPAGEGATADRFLSSFRVLVETDGGAAP